MDENVNSIPTSVNQPSVVAPTNPATPPMPEASATTPPSQPPVAKKSNKKIFIIAGVILAMLFMVMGMALAFTQMQPVQVVSTPTPVASATPMPVVEDPMADWKTYTGSTYTFKYPPELNPLQLEFGYEDNPIALFENYLDLEKCKKGEVDDPNTTCVNRKILISPPITMDEAEYLNSDYKSRLDPKTIKDSQNRIWETDMTLGEVYGYTGVYHNQKYTIVSFTSGINEVEYSAETGTGDGQSFRNFADQILSTFKFTE
jgi:hypothetical protein